MLELYKLKTFCTVAETSSFTQAAQALGYVQSNVTVQIKSLEKELGTLLFVRERFAKRVELTEAGRKVLDYAYRLLALEREAFSAVSEIARLASHQAPQSTQTS